MHSPLPFHPDDESIAPGETALFDRIATAMRKVRDHARYGDGAAARAGHAVTLAALKGRLDIHPDLPPELAQGLAATPRSYDLVARLSHLPAEKLDQRGVSALRGMALKLFDVPGTPLSGHRARTLDLVLDTAPTFNLSTPARFLAGFSAAGLVAPLPDWFKSAASATAHAAERALEAVGLHSDNLDLLGHDRLHPLTERFYSQVPLRWGAYVAKVALFPHLPAEPITVTEPDGLAAAVADRLSEQAVRLDLRVQLRTDAKAMPIEDAHARWPEAMSPFRPLGTVVFPIQPTLLPERVKAVDALSFSPAHGVEEHRHLGAINRARMHVYRMLAEERLAVLGATLREPQCLAEIPDVPVRADSASARAGG